MRVTGFVVAAMVLTGAAAFAQGIDPAGVGTNGLRIQSRRVPPVPVDAPVAESVKATGVTAEKAAAEAATEARRRRQIDIDCAPFLWSDVPSGWPGGKNGEPTLAALKTCIDEAGKDLEKASRVVATPESTLALVRAHVQYKKLKRWSEAARRKNERGKDEILLTADVARVGNLIHEALTNAHLNEPLSAMLVTGATFGDADEPKSKAGAGDAGSDVAKPAAALGGPSAMIVFESPHFGDDGTFPFHVAFGGKVGFQQVLSMVMPEGDAKTETEPAPVAAYKDGILWSAGASAYRPTGGKSEAYLRASIGGTRVGESRTVLESESNRGFLAVPVDAGSQVSAARWEVGLGWNYYGRPMEITHLDKSLLNPAFTAYAVWRKDRRFQKTGDLADFENPEARWVYGMSVNLKNLVTSDGDSVESVKGSTFDFGFTVEREFARGAGLRIPDSTRYMLRGSVNILNALSGAKKTAADTESAPSADDANTPPPAVPDPAR